MKRRAILWMVPKRRRDRYGEEIGALLEGTRGSSDLVDVAGQALRWQMEESTRDLWGILALILAAVSLFALGFAVNGLAGGVTELPRHWWSTAPVLGLVAAAAFGYAGRRRREGSG